MTPDAARAPVAGGGSCAGGPLVVAGSIDTSYVPDPGA